jgi:hypothetical protein
MSPKLCGPYVTPIIVPGAFVTCEVRGKLALVRLSKGPIPWPIGESDGAQSLIVYKALARAVRSQSPESVAWSFGVSLVQAEIWKATLTKRKAQAGRVTYRRDPKPAGPPKDVREVPLGYGYATWTKAADEIVRTLLPKEAAKLLRRGLWAVYQRRKRIGITLRHDGRDWQRSLRRKQRKSAKMAAIG